MGKEGWHNSFCSCFKSCPQCCLVWLCGMFGVACLQASVRGKMDPGTGTTAYCLACFLCCIGMGINRKKIRERYDIKGSACCDCCLYLCMCHICASTQEYQEVEFQKSSGINR